MNSLTTTARVAALASAGAVVLGLGCLPAAAGPRAGGLRLPRPAPIEQRQPVTDGFLRFAGDPDDYISGGGSFGYQARSGDRLNVYLGGDGRELRLAVDGRDAAWWSVDFASPNDAPLAVGTYKEARRYPFNGAAPGLDHGGSGRGCNRLSGEFTITKLVRGPHGYLHQFDATYVQYCEMGTAALRGEIHIDNPSPPAELQVGLATDTAGQVSPVSGKVFLTGAVTCNKATDVAVRGQLAQAAGGEIARGEFQVRVPCTPGGPRPWKATADSINGLAFGVGKVEVLGAATAKDTDYGTETATENRAIVVLTANDDRR